MNFKTVTDKLFKAGFYNYRKECDEVGPKIGVKVGDKGIWGYLPIDDESDEEFADFMIREATKLNNDPDYTGTDLLSVQPKKK
jgi:hypothetical protein